MNKNACGNKKNSCMGAYGNTLDIKITDKCDGTCGVLTPAECQDD